MHAKQKAIHGAEAQRMADEMGPMDPAELEPIARVFDADARLVYGHVTAIRLRRLSEELEALRERAADQADRAYERYIHARAAGDRVGSRAAHAEMAAGNARWNERNLYHRVIADLCRELEEQQATEMTLVFVFTTDSSQPGALTPEQAIELALQMDGTEEVTDEV